MASLLRFSARHCCQILKSRQPLVRSVVQPCAFISTSKKNKDAISVPVDDTPPPNLPKRPVEPQDLQEGPNTAGGLPDVDETITGLGEKDENWISFNYDLVNRDKDEFYAHFTLFCGVTIALVGVAYFYMYNADPKMIKWSQREAYLELARRRELGLPLIDRNYIPVERIELPADEEIPDDIEIII